MSPTLQPHRFSPGGSTIARLVLVSAEIIAEILPKCNQIHNQSQNYFVQHDKKYIPNQSAQSSDFYPPSIVWKKILFWRNLFVRQS
jgi:hypothetical protein